MNKKQIAYTIFTVENIYCGITFSWKTDYSMILANHIKWISTQLFECGKANFGLLARGHFHHVMLITALLPVRPVGLMEPYIIDCVNKPGQVPRESELAVYQFECVALTYWTIDREVGRDSRFFKSLKKEEDHTNIF